MTPLPRALASLLATLTACAADPAPPRPGVLTVSVEQQASWVRNFNPFLGGARWPSAAGIHEPLLVHSAVTGDFTPWLATAYRWEDDNLTLTFDLRQNVLWSDGRPFSAHDVVFTFELVHRFPALDQGALWTFLAAVEADGPRVRFRFARPYSPGLDGVARQAIVPAHIWEKIDDPLRFTNPDPVGTGPFTEVRVFRNQVWELGKNPRYWQPGRPAVDALRFLAFPSNDQANLALASGELDWAGNFVPAIERTFVAADPEHRGYWFPLVGSTVFLYANTTRPPTDALAVRRGLSMAIDREMLVRVATYDYTRPADGTALSDAFAAWRDPGVAASDSVRYDPEAAKRLFLAAGFALASDGLLRGPDNKPLSFEIIVVSGWSDWVRAAQVIARDLRALGLTISVRTLDFSPWLEKVQSGDFDLAIGWSNEGASPYAFYRWLMSSATVKPLGAPSIGNWHRYASPAADRLLAAFERTTDSAEQHELAVGLQRVFADELPAIPLFPNPSWGTYNSKRFIGFPTADDPYAQLSPNPIPECLLVLTRLEPRIRPAKGP